MSRAGVMAAEGERLAEELWQMISGYSYEIYYLLERHKVWLRALEDVVVAEVHHSSATATAYLHLINGITIKIEKNANGEERVEVIHPMQRGW
jgi:hypothetical protein